LSSKETPGGRRGRRFARLLWAVLFITTGAAATARAQQPRASSRRRTQASASFAGSLYQAQGQAQAEEEEEFIKPSRPTVANPAEFQKPGVLQVEYGYDANFRGEDFRT
jgi:hypothetical protein